MMESNLSGYLIWMGASVAAVFGLYALLRKKEEDLPPAWLAGLLAAALGFLCAKAVYYLAQIDFMIAEGWRETLLRMDPEYFSFFGGVAGVCLGVALAAKCRGLRPMAALNFFAPLGLLLAALARFGEYFLGLLGCGPYLEEGSPFAFFPLSMGFSYGDDWTEWYLAVFLLEGLTLAILSGVFFGRERKNRFIRALFWLCLPQILFENLRAASFMWFFCIRVEQLACMVTMFVILVIYGARTKGGKERWIPALIALGCAGLFIVCEFAMEGKILFLQFLDLFACYGLMALGLVILGWTEIWAFKKYMRSPRHPVGNIPPYD